MYYFENVVDLMISTGYSFDTLNSIFDEEVAPVVYTNLHSSVGVWSGFDEVWLFEQIIENIRKQERNTIYRLWVRSKTGKFVMTKMVQEDWKKIALLYRQKVRNI